MDETCKSYIKLTAIPEVGSATATRLVNYFGSPQEVLKASKQQLMCVEKIGDKISNSIINNKDKIDIEKTAERMNALGVKYIHKDHQHYPKLLKQLPDAPIGFYMMGDLDLSATCISIIGSRTCSIYGQTIAKQFAKSLSRAGFTIVSGMARGIDSYAHQGALEADGNTVAVLGTGIDIVYPPENGNLYNQIAQKGAIISEFPMGTKGERQNFPMRNRIVSGLCVATLVVESDIKGGSMITARLAGEQGREVFAIPGRIDIPSSRGCNALIRDGVRLVTSPDEIIEELTFGNQLEMNFAPQPKLNKPVLQKTNTKPKVEIITKPNITLSNDESTIYNFLKANENVDIDMISENTNIAVSKCLSLLLMLEMKKVIAKNAGNSWSIKQII